MNFERTANRRQNAALIRHRLLIDAHLLKCLHTIIVLTVACWNISDGFPSVCRLFEALSLLYAYCRNFESINFLMFNLYALIALVWRRNYSANCIVLPQKTLSQPSHLLNISVSRHFSNNTLMLAAPKTEEKDEIFKAEAILYSHIILTNVKTR